VKNVLSSEEDRWITLRVAASVKQLIKWNCCSFEKSTSARVY
jgi:hypothetical protein